MAQEILSAPATISMIFLKNPPGQGEFPQARLMNALVDFDKPLIAAVQGAARRF
jgi:enoyl-CoA hydratase/carnithine racemase